jgi:hypothetical protein
MIEAGTICHASLSRHGEKKPLKGIVSPTPLAVKREHERLEKTGAA